MTLKLVLGASHIEFLASSHRKISAHTLKVLKQGSLFTVENCTLTGNQLLLLGFLSGQDYRTVSDLPQSQNCTSLAVLDSSGHKVKRAQQLFRCGMSKTRTNRDEEKAQVIK